MIGRRCSLLRPGFETPSECSARVRTRVPARCAAFDVFEGPLDLLLHLIKKNEVEIVDIPMATITEQYMAYLEMMRDLNLSALLRRTAGGGSSSSWRSGTSRGIPSVRWMSTMD